MEIRMLSSTRCAMKAAADEAGPGPRQVTIMANGIAVRSSSLLAYGFLGLPLAFAAMPLYLMLPDWYARMYGIPLALIGLLLLVTRLGDALVDPLIGLWIERVRARADSYRVPVCVALPLLAAGFIGLFHPPSWALAMLPAWACLMLVITNLGFSTATIAWQSWGAAAGGSAAHRARVSAVREIFSIGGVLLATALPSAGGMPLVSGSLVLLLVLAAVLLAYVPNQQTQASAGFSAAIGTRPAASMLSCWTDTRFRRLLVIFALNGIASALPASLLLFFVRDSLKLESQAPVFLAIYFLAAACAMPAWVKAVARFGLVRAWLAGMMLAVCSFAWVMLLPGAAPGTAYAGFALVCAVSGVAVGADLALPAALLAGVIRRSGGEGRKEGRKEGRQEGPYFGAWNLVVKLNLALAAGASLPLLQLAGYQPGAGHVAALTLMYGLAPCVMKLCAAALLWRWRTHLETT